MVKAASHADEVQHAADAAGRILTFSTDYRKNLMRWTGRTADEVKDLQAHHMLPQELEKEFSKINGIQSIHDPRYLTWVSSSHQEWRKAFNRDWQDWFDKLNGRQATLDAVKAKAEELARKYGLDWNPPPGIGE